MTETLKRKIIHIDEDLCDGCGQCVPACAEGALQIIDGKAKLVDEIYCDGLGDCLGECPQGAITMEEREAKPFDEKAVEEHLDRLKERNESEHHAHHSATPCTASQQIRQVEEDNSQVEDDVQGDRPAPRLENWPIQIKLVSPEASFLQCEHLVIAADCVPFAYPDFHEKFLKGKSLLIGCPKLDDPELYLDRLTEIFKKTNPQTVTVAIMEVPCCSGMINLVERAKENAMADFTLHQEIVKIDGSLR